MKTQKFIVGVPVMALSMLLLTACPKKPYTPGPTPDKELQSSVDASFALYRITDAEMMAAFVSDNDRDPEFYKGTPGRPGGITVIGNVEDGRITLEYSNVDGHGTHSADGPFRQGNVTVDCDARPDINPLANENSVYYRRSGFAGRMALQNYIVDGWHINTANKSECLILNQLPSNNFDRNSINASWAIKGSFIIEKDGKSMSISVDLVKTLLNTSDPAVFPTSSTAYIKWPLANVAYSGKVSGLTFDNQPFTMTIDKAHPLVRNFTCSPDVVADVKPASANSMNTTISEFHPFVDGVAYFKVGNAYQREIYYGGSEAEGIGQCDNSGAIAIKGISYPVDFNR